MSEQCHLPQESFRTLTVVTGEFMSQNSVNCLRRVYVSEQCQLSQEGLCLKVCQLFQEFVSEQCQLSQNNVSGESITQNSVFKIATGEFMPENSAYFLKIFSVLYLL